MNVYSLLALQASPGKRMEWVKKVDYNKGRFYKVNKQRFCWTMWPEQSYKPELFSVLPVITIIFIHKTITHECFMIIF